MSDKPARKSKWFSRRWIWITLSILAFVTVALILAEAENTIDVSQSETAPPAQLVTVVSADRRVSTAVVTVFAELRPRWDADIRSAVSGRITHVYDAALAGSRVARDAPLMTIENSAYLAEVAAAKLSVEDAKLTLARAQNTVTIAKRQFERDGIAPPNEMAIHLPEQRIAEHALASARAQLAASERQLAETEITAPFSGFITERFVSLGQTVAAGEPMVRLSDNKNYELIAELSPADWALLSHPIAGNTVEIFHPNGQNLGKATIRQGGGYLDRDTRQMRVFLDVSNPHVDLLAGDYLGIAFQGRDQENTVTLPETAITRAGHIWRVDADNRLVRFMPEILFRDGDNLTFSAPQGPGPWQFAITPLASFLPGQTVTPTLAEE